MVNDPGDKENNFKENQERKSTNADDPRKGACFFGDDTANIDSSLLYQSQSHNNRHDKDDNDRVVMKAVYLDDFIVSSFP